MTTADMQTIEVEKKRDLEIVVPAGKKAFDYTKWAMDEIMKGNMGETMQLVCQHTRVWGITQGILSELAIMDKIHQDVLKKNKTMFGKKQSEEAIRQKAMTLKSIFLAKMLREIFVDGTNFTEVTYHEEF